MKISDRTYTFLAKSAGVGLKTQKKGIKRMEIKECYSAASTCDTV